MVRASFLASLEIHLLTCKMSVLDQNMSIPSLTLVLLSFGLMKASDVDSTLMFGQDGWKVRQREPFLIIHKTIFRVDRSRRRSSLHFIAACDAWKTVLETRRSLYKSLLIFDWYTDICFSVGARSMSFAPSSHDIRDSTSSSYFLASMSMPPLAFTPRRTPILSNEGSSVDPMWIFLCIIFPDVDIRLGVPAKRCREPAVPTETFLYCPSVYI